MPFAVVFYFEVEVLAFGQNRFGVGGPEEFARAAGLALEAEFKCVGAGLCDGEALEGEAGVGAGAVEDELGAGDGELGVFAGSGNCGGGLGGLLFAVGFALGLGGDGVVVVGPAGVEFRGGCGGDELGFFALGGISTLPLHVRSPIYCRARRSQNP